MNEREITQKLIKGDSDALEIIITEYNSYVTAIVRTVLCEYKNEADIQGLVNQVFFLLWKNCQKIDFSKCDSIKYFTMGLVGLCCGNVGLERAQEARNDRADRIAGDLYCGFSGGRCHGCY